MPQGKIVQVSSLFFLINLFFLFVYRYFGHVKYGGLLEMETHASSGLFTKLYMVLVVDGIRHHGIPVGALRGIDPARKKSDKIR